MPTHSLPLWGLLYVAFATAIWAPLASAQSFAPLAGTRVVTPAPGTEERGGIELQQLRTLIADYAHDQQVQDGDTTEIDRLGEVAEEFLQLLDLEAQGAERTPSIQGGAPVLPTSVAANSFFGGFNLANATSVQLGADGGSIYSEFFTDNVYLGNRLGHGRVGFGALVSGASSEDDASASTFLGNGGNVSLNLALPLVYHEGLEPKDGVAVGKDRFTFGLFVFPRVATELPALNGQSESPTYNVDLPLEARATFLSLGDVFAFGANARISATLGSADFKAQQNPNCENNWDTLFCAFGYGTFDVRIDLANTFRIGARKVLFGPEPLESLPIVLSVQLLGKSE